MGIMGFSEIMDTSFEILRKYLKTIIFYNIGMGIVAFISVFAIMFFFLLALIPGAFYPNPSGLWVAVFFIAVLILSVTFSISIGIIKITGQYFEESKVYAYDAIKAAIKKFPAVIGLVFIGGLLFVPVAAAAISIFIAITKGINMSVNGMMDIGLGGATVIIMVIALIAATILVSIGYLTIFSFALQAIIIEEKGVEDAIKRSYRLVKTNYFKLVGCNLLIIAAIYAINLSLESFLGLVISIVFMVMRFLNIQQEFLLFISSLYSQVSWPLTLLSWLIITPIGTIMLTVLYYNERFKKEGHDLLIRLKQIQEGLKG